MIPKNVMTAVSCGQLAPNYLGSVPIIMSSAFVLDSPRDSYFKFYCNNSVDCIFGLKDGKTQRCPDELISG